MFFRNRFQRVDKGSVALQADGDIVINQGISYADAKQISLDVFQENFYRLAEPAMETARRRAEELAEAFFSELKEANPNGIANASDPDFQYGLYTAQQAYARSGDKDLGDVLVDILLQRSKEDDRSILQIVLNESLTTAPKLTSEQVAILALIFYFRYSTIVGPMSQPDLKERWGLVLDSLPPITVSSACFQHLEFASCGTMYPNSVTLQEVIREQYAGLFSNGFEEARIAELGVEGMLRDEFFMTCINDDSKMQVRAKNRKSLDALLDKYDISTQLKSGLESLFESHHMGHDELRNKCVSLCPKLENIFDLWDAKQIGHFSLTSVGVAIGHAKVRAVIGEPNLSIWIK